VRPWVQTPVPPKKKKIKKLKKTGTNDKTVSRVCSQTALDSNLKVTMTLRLHMELSEPQFLPPIKWE
jgi:hypothetical protein